VVRLIRHSPADVATALVVAATLAGCSAGRPSAVGASSSAPSVSGPPPDLVSAVLEDSSVPQDDGLVSWTTTWRACFQPGLEDTGEVARWEVRAVTTEGSSPEIDELPGGCIDLDVAAGVNATADGMPGREIQLSDAQALAYRVRVVRDDGTVTPWTDVVRVGTLTAAR
jgi:hypothetical protein